jgi:uncharacterized protein DUF4232
MKPALLVATVVVGLAGCGGGGGTATVTVTHTRTATRTVTVSSATTGAVAAGPCLASALAGNFALIPGSAGAGQIAYRLRLTNQSDSECFVSGLPAAQLLDQGGAKLPSSVTPDQPGTATAVRVDLKPGDAATADARFSPDIPGGSEPGDGPCEAKAVTLRVTIGGGTVDAAIVPPTPVCERGQLQFRNFTAAP